MQLQLDSVRYRLGVDAHEKSSSDLAKSCCVSSASEVVLGVKAAWDWPVPEQMNEYLVEMLVQLYRMLQLVEHVILWL